MDLDEEDLILLRALFNAQAQGRGVQLIDLAERLGMSVRNVRERLEALADDQVVHLNDARGARTATLLPAGTEVLHVQQIVVNSGTVQIGRSNVQLIGEIDGAEEDLDDDEENEDDEEDEDDDGGFDDDENAEDR